MASTNTGTLTYIVLLRLGMTLCHSYSLVLYSSLLLFGFIHVLLKELRIYNIMLGEATARGVVVKVDNVWFCLVVIDPTMMPM